MKAFTLVTGSRAAAIAVCEALLSEGHHASVIGCCVQTDRDPRGSSLFADDDDTAADLQPYQRRGLN